MSKLSRPFIDLPPEQLAIRAKCFHPTGAFEEFLPEDLEGSIPERFEKVAGKNPARTAIKTKNQQLSYDALNRAANRLARAILARRGEAQEPIALFVEHGISLIIGHLAVLKTGKLSLRLDPSMSQSRIAHLLEDSRAAVILTDGANDSMAREWAKQETSLINVDELDVGLGDQNLGLSISPDASAYIRYTSGSTGQAKGGLKTHRHVLHAVMNATNYFRISADDRMALLGRASLGKHVFEALLNGARLCPLDITDEGLVHLADWLIQEEITIYGSFPTLFRYFASTLSGGEAFPKLRLIRLEGEPVYKRDVELFKIHFASECLFVNSFSSTETGPISLQFVDRETAITGSRVPVGYPVKGVDIFLLDQCGKAVGFNQSGEIAVRSYFLSSGYWQRPELTRAKFLSEPSGGEQRVYLTGDLGQMSEDGCLELLGRKDSAVKIRSFRVDLDEVEAALADCPGVREAIVVAREDRFGNRKLIGYVMPREQPSPTVAKLRDFLTEKVPDYMIPSALIILDKLPLTPTGKVDRRALPEPSDSRPELDTPYAAPRTGIEENLAAIWADVLSLAQVGIHDGFFDLGGHSLAATRVVSQVIKQFQLELPLQSLFESTTVATMAAVITEHQGKKVGEKELDRILTELESLTDEEARRLLADKSGTVQRSD